MKAEWSISRRPETMNIPDREMIKTPEMQFRRELTMLHQEAAFQERVPFYGVLSIDMLTDENDCKELTNILPEAKSAILMGYPIEDPWNRMWHRIGGISMNKFTTMATSSLELILLTFADKLEDQGYKAVIRQLPLTPTNQHNRLFELDGAGFIGKNHLVITKEYGCRVNLGAIITDAPLLHGDYRYEPYNENLCGDCTLCEEYCPSGALKNGKYDPVKCETYVDDPKHQMSISPHTLFKCDACMRVCPMGSIGKWDSQIVRWTTILEERKINF